MLRESKLGAATAHSNRLSGTQPFEGLIRDHTQAHSGYRWRGAREMSIPDHETNAEKLTELLDVKDQRIDELERLCNSGEPGMSELKRVLVEKKAAQERIAELTSENECLRRELGK